MNPLCHWGKQESCIPYNIHFLPQLKDYAGNHGRLLCLKTHTGMWGKNWLETATLYLRR